MKDGQFYQISGWMGKYLELRGNDLICFAVIYGFSMDGESQFKGNLDYLTGCMFASRPTALLCLNHLLECNLILKQEEMINGKKHCYYATNVMYDEGKINVVDTSKEPLSMTSKEPLSVTSKEPLPKKYNNKEQYNKEEKELSKDNPKKMYSEDFLSFWKLYHEGSKQQAYKEWKKLKDKEKEKALTLVDNYLKLCLYSGRKKKDVSSYLHQHGFDDDWLATPDCYVVKEGDNERMVKFKNYMVSKHIELIFHRNPITFEQLDECFTKYTYAQTEWAMNMLKQRDIHQYFSILKGIEAVIAEDPIFDEMEKED